MNWKRTDANEYSFLVQSESSTEWYQVWLDEFKFGGSCACKAFMMKHWKTVNNGATPSDKTRCKHIKAMRKVFCEERARAAWLKAAQEIGD